jgi:opacity protein-like surface antigen
MVRAFFVVNILVGKSGFLLFSLVKNIFTLINVTRLFIITRGVKMKFLKKSRIGLVVSAFMLFFYFPQGVNAQSIGTLPLAIQGGFNLANFGGDANTDMRLGIHLGANTLYELNEEFIWEPGIQLSLVGGKGTQTDVSLDGFQVVEEKRDYKINQWYINIPLPVRYELQEGIILKGGPYLGFLVGSKFKDGNQSTNTKSSYKALDLGLILGAAYRLQEDIEVGLGYNLGIMNISDFNLSGYKISNQALQISIRYALLTDLANK